MSIKQWFEDRQRVNRAGRIAGNKSELENLKSLESLSDKESKRIKKLTNAIAKDEERQKIASERNSRSTFIDKSKRTINQNDTKVNNNVNYKGTQNVDNGASSTIKQLDIKPASTPKKN